MENELLTKGKEFNIEITSDKNNTYSIQFTLNNSLEIVANQKNAVLNKSFSNKFTIHEIQQNKYFVQFDTLNEIYDEVIERTKKDKITITENENTLIINIPLPSTKYTEQKFELKQISKNDNEKINDLTQLVIKQNKEITDLKNELKDIKEKLNILWKEREEEKQISNLNSKNHYDDESVVDTRDKKIHEKRKKKFKSKTTKKNKYKTNFAPPKKRKKIVEIKNENKYNHSKNITSINDLKQIKTEGVGFKKQKNKKNKSERNDGFYGKRIRKRK